MFNSGFLSLDGASHRQSQQRLAETAQKITFKQNYMTNFKVQQRHNLFSPQNEANYLSNMIAASSSH